MESDICQKIGTLLIDKDLKNQGLLYGKMGTAIFFYHLSEKLQDEKYLDYADKLIDEILTQLTPISTFRDGFTGIGWGIEYIVQHNFCKGDTDEILEDIDTKIYTILNDNKDMQFGLYNGYIGYLQYYIMRLKHQTRNSLDSTRINMEMLKLIINKIDQITPVLFVNLVRDISFILFDDFFILFWSIIEAYQLNICNNKIVNMLKQWETYLIAYFPSQHFNRLFLAISLFRINNIIKSSKADNQIKTLLYSINADQLKTEINIINVKNVRQGYLGQLIILDKCIKYFDTSFPNYSLIQSMRIDLLNLCNPLLINELNNASTDNNELINIKYGLAEGWTGVGLLLLLLPNLLEIK